MESEPLALELEFGRVSSTSDPYGFQFIPQDYFLRRGQGAYDSAHFPWTAELLGALAAVRLPGRSPVLVQQLGDTLRQFLATTGWATSEAQILSAVEQRRPVVLTLRSRAAELYSVPWELMTLQPTGQHLGELPSVLLRYEWPGVTAAPEEPRLRGAGGRILFAWSNAGGEVPAVQHQQAIARACAAAAHPFDPALDVLPKVSCGRLIAALEQAATAGPPVSVLHLLCHGTAQGNSFGLAFHDDSPLGEKVVVDAARLRQLLAPYAGMVRLVVLSACDSGNSGALGNHLGSIAQELQRGRIAQIVASRYPLSVGGSVHLAETFYAQLVGGSTDVAQAFLAARQRLAEDPTELDWAAVQLYGAADPVRPILFCPYPGLLPFSPQPSRFFFGREREGEELAARFFALAEKKAPRLLVLIGASGSGKSSLLSAAVLPKLLGRLGPTTKVARLAPGATPLQALTQALADINSGDKPLLVVDQFEELFTHGADDAERQRFWALLWSMVSGDAPKGSVIVSLRSDFVSRAAELPIGAGKLGSLLASSVHTYGIVPPAATQLREAIVKPALAVGLQLEPGLVERLLGEVEAQPGALPLLQYTLALLWQRREGNRLTQQAFAALGGVAGALHGLADQLVDSLEPEEQRLLQHLLLWLGNDWTKESPAVRRRLPIAALRPPGGAEQERFDRLLPRLVSARILVTSAAGSEKGGRENSVEITHDSLLHKWARLLAWADKARPMLAVRESLDRWVAEWRLHGTLLSGSQLGYAVQMATTYPDALGQDARELLSQSERARLQAEEMNRHGLDTLRLLAAKSAFAADCSRVAVALLATTATGAVAIPGWLEAALDIMHNQVLCTTEIEYRQGFYDARWSPDGQTVVLASADGTTHLWAEGTKSLQRLGADPPPSPSYCSRVSYSPDGEKILILYGDGTVQVASASSGEELVQLVGHNAAIAAGAWSRDGRFIATASDDKTARLFDAATGKQLAVLSGPKVAVVGVVFSPDSQRIYTAYQDGSVSVFSQQKERKWTPTVLIESEVELTSLAISADGTQLATGSADWSARVYDLSNLEEPQVLVGHGATVWMVAFSPDGERLLTCSADNTARLWSLRAARPPCLLMGHRLTIYSGSFSHDGKKIVTACSDGRVRIWDATRTGLTNPKLVKTRAALPAGFIYRTDSLQVSDPTVQRADGKYSATLTDTSTVVVKPQPGPGTPITIDAGTDSIGAIRFTASGDRLIVIAQQRILICELKARTIRTFAGHTAPITCFEVSADSAWLVTGAEDWTARVWPLAGTGEHRTLAGHQGTPGLVLFGADSHTVLTVEMNGPTRVWPTWGPPIVLLPDGRPDQTVAITPDWKKLVTQTAEDEEAPLYLWELELEHKPLQSRLQAATKLELAEEEYHMIYLQNPRSPTPTKS